jgi:hypothetical protein
MGSWSGVKSSWDRPLPGRTVANRHSPARGRKQLLPTDGVMDCSGLIGALAGVRLDTAPKPILAGAYVGIRNVRFGSSCPAALRTGPHRRGARLLHGLGVSGGLSALAGYRPIQ